MTLEGIGFVLGIIGALWMKSALGLLERERRGGGGQLRAPKSESAALKAFLRGIALILAGFGCETFARLFLNHQ
ncbi:MAG TPA: hypothetical protein VNL14_07315 [Candidatus Acidoferrales bacterium]|nr:hypothetical protein [Candidatus Acidoferrales bacterium]